MKKSAIYNIPRINSMDEYRNTVTGASPYPDILRRAQEHMSSTCQALLNKNELTGEDVFSLKKHIENFLIVNAVRCDEALNTARLVDRIYKDMVLYSFLTDYLDERKIDELGLEEININSWDCIFLNTSKQGKVRIPERFLSPQNAVDVILRMLRHSRMTLDDRMPCVLGHIRRNVRIAVFKSPILDDDVSVAASIRIVSFSKLSRENLLSYRTVNEEMLNLLEIFVRHKVSMVIAGETGSGKTGTAGYLLATLARDPRNRVITLEEGSRELYLVEKDSQGRPTNDVLHVQTRPDNDPQYNIDQDAILQHLLRFDPGFCGIGEMRSKESFTVAETCLTGHSVITTTHSKSAVSTYARMVILAKKAHEFEDSTLYSQMVSAFPVIVFQEQLEDGSRKITEIIEAEGVSGIKVCYRTLYRYVIEDYRQNPDGSIAEVFGHFEREKPISETLREQLIRKGLTRAAAQKL